MKLINALNHAILDCYNQNDEECGGIILCRGDNYMFTKLRNQNTGTPKAQVLWTADRNEYSRLVYPLLFAKDGKWQQHGSFHTHPQWSPNFSSEDLRSVFRSYPINYIFGGLDRRLVKYYWEDECLMEEEIKYGRREKC